MASAAAAAARAEAILSHTHLLSMQLQRVSALEPAPASVFIGSGMGASGGRASAAAAASWQHASAAAASAASAAQAHLSRVLPTRSWSSLPVTFDPDQVCVAGFRMRHGDALPELEVRVLHNHVLTDARTAAELDSALQWLMDSIAVGSAYPVLGVDCESDTKLDSDGEVRLLQLATGTRCLLIRIPAQSAIRQFCAEVALEHSIAHSAASGSSTGASSSPPPPPSPPPSPLFTNLFHTIMQNRAIFKAGAELWTDALDLWSCCPGVELNSCLNMSWIFRNPHGGAMSLAAMVNLSLGADRSFLKDRETTCSNWGEGSLSVRQLIYAALDAQTSFVAGANQMQIPKPFHVSDMPRAWLTKAAAWKRSLRGRKMETEALGRSRPSASSQAETLLLDAAYRYFAQFMQGEEPFSPWLSCLLRIPFPSAQTAAQSMPPANAHLLPPDVEQPSLPPSPTLFHSDDLVIETANVGWWLSSKLDLPPGMAATLQSHSYWNMLHESQQRALQISDQTRMHMIHGPPGTGKTVCAAVEAVRALHRPSSLPAHQVPPALRMAPQRVLCVCESEIAARQMADCLAMLLPPDRLILFVSQEFLHEWTADQYPRLRSLPYVSGMDDSPGSSSASSKLHSDRDVIVCTLDWALATQFPRRLRHRQTVIIDEAQNVWLLKATLLLRKLPHTERLILVGDENQLPAVLGSKPVDSVFAAAHSALRASYAHSLFQPKVFPPPPFRPMRTELPHHFRMAPHLVALISTLFYQDALALPHAASSRGEQKQRAVGWVDVKANTAIAHPPSSVAGSAGSHAEWSNPAEMAALVRLWNHFASRPGFTLEQIAVLCWNSAQRRAMIQAHPTMASRVADIESFQGQQADIVLLSLAAPAWSLDLETPKQRLNVALSRARSKLFIVGDRACIANSPASLLAHSLWSEISQFELTDMDQVFPPDGVDEAELTHQAQIEEIQANPDEEETNAFPALAATAAAKSNSPVVEPQPAPSAAASPAPSPWKNVAGGSSSPPLNPSSAAASASFAPLPPPHPTSNGLHVSRNSPGLAPSASPSYASSLSPASSPVPSLALSASAAKGPSVSGGARYSQTPQGNRAAAHTFVPVPETRAFKVLPCDKIHSVEGATHKLKSHCYMADKCGFLHSDFWVRVNDAGEYWVVTPGSKTIHVDQVEPWNTRRIKQLESIIASPNNKNMLAKHAAKEIGLYLMPAERTAPIQQQQQQQQQTPAKSSAPPSTPPRSVVAAPSVPEDAAETSHVPEEEPAETGEAPQSVSEDAATVSEAPVSELSAEAKLARKEAKKLKLQKLKEDKEREKAAQEAATLAALAAEAKAAAAAAAAAAKIEEFVPVTGRRAVKHPSNLAAALAAEQQRLAQAAAVASASASAPSEESEPEAPVKQERNNNASRSKRSNAGAAPVTAASAAAPVASSSSDSKHHGKDSKRDSSPAVSSASTAPPSAPEVSYSNDMSPHSYFTVGELALLSKNARKKLLWLCPSCMAPNEASLAKCALCETAKPAPSVLRYQKSASSSAAALPLAVSDASGARSFVYQNEWVRLSSLGGGTGGHNVPCYVAQKLIPAGTIILKEEPLLSNAGSVPLAPNGKPATTAAALAQATTPGPKTVAQLAVQLLSDPVQMALLRARGSINVWTEAQTKMVLRSTDATGLKPPAVDNRDWTLALQTASTAKFVKDVHEGHQPNWSCHRFKLSRQSNMLVPSCWPNTAVVYLHCVPTLVGEERVIQALTDIPAGSVLSNISEQAWMTMPRERRQQSMSMARWRATGVCCMCERCSGPPGDADRALDAVLKGPQYPAVDKVRMASEFEHLMRAYSATQDNKDKLVRARTAAAAAGANAAATDAASSSAGPKSKDSKDDSDGMSDTEYFSLCYSFLTQSFEWLTIHPLAPSHWRMQKVRELYLSLVRCDFLYRSEHMVLGGVTGQEGQHSHWRQMLHVLDVSIRSDMAFFLPMEPLKSLPLLTLLELCTELLNKKTVILPAAHFSKLSNPTKIVGTKAGASASGATSVAAAGLSSVTNFRLPTMEFEGMGRFDFQANYLLTLSQLNTHAATIRTLNFPYRRP